MGIGDGMGFEPDNLNRHLNVNLAIHHATMRKRRKIIGSEDDASFRKLVQA
jgi:hypothetical protein